MEGEGEGVGCYGMGCCSPHTDHRAPNTKPLVVASRAQQRRADLTVSGCAGRKHRKEDGVSDTVVREAAAAVETLRSSPLLPFIVTEVFLSYSLAGPSRRE